MTSLLNALLTIFDWLGDRITIIKVLYKLGKGLAGRKIAIFAKGDSVNSLMRLLTETKLFQEKNVITISDVGDLGWAEQATVFLVHWIDWMDDFDAILDLKKQRDKAALIVYAPQKEGFILPETMDKLSQPHNVTVTNFRGRLLNDIVVSMITTGYQ
ncbi:MAG TPA: hypothetical protein VKQ36_01315 [Ktedonobacterales bacterium]|nr:hypothetical protein [Ktedonobacterales bacterium]